MTPEFFQLRDRSEIQQTWSCDSVIADYSWAQARAKLFHLSLEGHGRQRQDISGHLSWSKVSLLLNSCSLIVTSCVNHSVAAHRLLFLLVLVVENNPTDISSTNAPTDVCLLFFCVFLPEQKHTCKTNSSSQMNNFEGHFCLNFFAPGN